MRSMTGFGAGEAQLATGTLSVEIRALNHRHQDLRLRLPTHLMEYSAFLEHRARAVLGRGRYDIAVRVDGEHSGQLRLNTARLESLFQSLQEIAQRLTPEQPLRLEALLSLPDVLSAQGPDPQVAQAALTGAFDQAVIKLEDMRVREGQALFNDLRTRAGALGELRKRVELGSADLVAHHRKKLIARISQLVSDPVVLSQERLEQEVALLADRSDITEELVRLDSHLHQFLELLDKSEPIGRQLDFLLQEVGREVNTIASKSQHAPVSHLVVEMKSEVERLREQVQNVA